MLKKLMSGIVIGSIVLSMVGCTDTKESVKHEVPDTSNSTRQEQQEQPKQQIIQQQEENTPQDVQEPVKDNKEQPKEEVKEQPVQQKEQQKEQFDDGDADIQFLCPNCNHTLENPVEEYGCPWCGFYPGEENNSNYNDVYENEPQEDNTSDTTNLYWCDRCKCFSTSKHDHTQEEIPSIDYSEDVQADEFMDDEE